MSLRVHDGYFAILGMKREQNTVEHGMRDNCNIFSVSVWWREVNRIKLMLMLLGAGGSPPACHVGG
jgi:hypothetical protein